MDNDSLLIELLKSNAQKSDAQYDSIINALTTTNNHLATLNGKVYSHETRLARVEEETTHFAAVSSKVNAQSVAMGRMKLTLAAGVSIVMLVLAALANHYLG